MRSLYRWAGFVLLLVLFGCSIKVSTRAEDEKRRQVTLYSGGKVVRQWRGVTGVLMDPVQFKDPETGERVTLTGTVAVEAEP